MKKINIEEQHKKEIIEMANRGIGYKTIHKNLNVSYSNIVIRRYLIEENLVNSKNLYRKYNCNQDFFEIIDSEAKAYWLGFLYADGNVSRNTIKIRLSERDYSHLEKFREAIQGKDYEITRGTQNSFGTMTRYSQISINSAKMKSDLVKLGCVPNKSLILKFPNLSQVPEYLQKHFIRGYFDGDGSIIVPKTVKYPQTSLSFLGTEDMLQHIKTILKVQTPIKLDKRSNKIYVLLFGGNINVSTKLDFMYKNAQVYLSRKYKTYTVLKNK